MVRPETEGGWGLDAVWADDFHHECRRLLAGDADGYYRDFTGRTHDLAETIRRGWFFTGQHSEHLGGPRGTDPAGIPLPRFVVCLQNHDQVGNRALGERLHHQIDRAAFRAASVLLFLVPETPLIFMGQEWSASAPFLYFTDHHEPLGHLVTEGRREEFRHFSAFTDPAARQRIPDPQAEATFLQSRLDWTERDREPHASTLRLYQALIDLRRQTSALRQAASFQCEAADEDTVVIRYDGPRERLLVVVRLRGAGRVLLDDAGVAALDAPDPSRTPWRIALTSEDAEFCADAQPVSVDWTAGSAAIQFARPGAVVLDRSEGPAQPWRRRPSRS
jgi:maltooligosyltrehalose trehalohydrolase